MSIVANVEQYVLDVAYNDLSAFCCEKPETLISWNLAHILKTRANQQF